MDKLGYVGIVYTRRAFFIMNIWKLTSNETLFNLLEKIYDTFENHIFKESISNTKSQMLSVINLIYWIRLDWIDMT